MSKSSIQNNVRKHRFLAGELTQQEVADRVGVSRQTIVAIEKGSYSPSLELAFRIAHLFDTTLEEVFSYDPEKDTLKTKK